MTSRTASAAVVACYLICATSAFPQRPTPTVSNDPAPRTFTIRGNVRLGTSHMAVDMIRVSLKRFSGEEVNTAYTRSNGEFEFGGLFNGSYVLAVDEQGYDQIREPVSIDGISRVGVLLLLKAIPKTNNPQESGEVVSARELALPQKTRESYRKGLDKLYVAKDQRASLSFFQKTIVEKPDYYEALHHMGVAYLELGQMADAEASFRRSIQLSAGHFAPPHFALAGMMTNTGKFAEAEASVRSGQKSDMESWQGHYELARALMGLNRTAEAEVSAREARTRRPDYAPVHLLMANIHIRKGDGTALLADLDEYLKLDPAGPNSANVRQMRESVQQKLAQSQPHPAPPQQP